MIGETYKKLSASPGLSAYTSHMPEANAPTFKSKFEAELAAAERQAPANVIKLLLCDGARPLWNYKDNRECFEDYEKIINIYHTAERLNLAAEALFGKESDKAKAWYAKYRKQLLEKDGGARSVLRSMDYYSKTRALSLSQALLCQMAVGNSFPGQQLFSVRKGNMFLGSCQQLCYTDCIRVGTRSCASTGQM